MRAMYSSSISATPPIFFPPRFQVVAFEQDSDRLSSHPRHQLALHRLLRQQAHRPPRPALRRRTADQGHDALPLLGTALLSPVAPAHTRPPPARLAGSVGRSATPSSGSIPRCGLPCESFARPPVAAAPRRVALFVPAVDRRSAIYPIAAAPTWTTEPEFFPDLPCVPAIRSDIFADKYPHVLLSMWS